MKGLVVENLVKRYGSVVAVDDISFTVAPGAFISLLGPSGCGKTTTLRCIAGFEQPDAGRIAINDEAIVDGVRGVFRPPNRRHFGMVFQSYAIWPHMKVIDNVGYPLRVKGKLSRQEIAERARQKLRSVGLDGFEERYPSQLSGGQQQRVALARALVMEPKVLLFDEPLSNLDAKLRERMRFELVAIQQDLGIPAVYVTHDQAEAMVMSDTVIVMEGGKIAQQGDPESIYNSPGSRFVADFIGLSNFLEATITKDNAGGSYQVATALGELTCRGAPDLDRNAKVSVVIRPEHLLLSAEPLSGPGAFTAELSSRYFVGPYIEYFVSTGGTELRVQTRDRIPVEPGGKLYARVTPEYCRIVLDKAGVC